TGARICGSATRTRGSPTSRWRASAGWPPSPAVPPRSWSSPRTGRPTAGATCPTSLAWPRPAGRDWEASPPTAPSWCCSATPEQPPGGQADVVRAYANQNTGPRFATFPVAVFLTRDFRELYRYIEYPAIYHKDRVIGHLRGARAGETEEQAKARGGREIGGLLESPFFDLLATPGIPARLPAPLPLSS